MREQQKHDKEQKQILSFHDEGEAMRHRMFIPDDKFRSQMRDLALGDVLHHDIINFTERVIRFINFTITNNGTLWTDIITPSPLKPEDVIFGISNIIEKISGFFAIDCEVHFTFKFNISPMGAGIVWIGQRYESLDGNTDVIDDPVLASPLGTWINLNTTRTHVEVVKYNADSPWYGLTKNYNFGSWPRVYAKVGSPYRNPNSENLSGCVFVSLQNVKLRYPTVEALNDPPSMSSVESRLRQIHNLIDKLNLHERTNERLFLEVNKLNIDPKSDVQVHAMQMDDQEDEINDGLVSKTIVKVKETAQVIDEIVPNVIPMEAITQVADIALDLSRMAGFSKPFSCDMPTVADIGTNKGMNNLDGVISGYQMGDFNGTLLPVGPNGSDAFDEMNISSFTSRKAFIDQFQITTTQNPGDKIWAKDLAPQLYFLDRIPADPFLPFQAHTPLSFSSRFFKYWHGDLTFTFLVAKNAMQNFSMRIYFLAGVHAVDIPANGFDFTKAPSRVYDCGDISEVEFTCSFNAHEMWKQTGGFINSNNVIGSIMIELVNKLTTTTAAADVIDILVLVSSNNMQFNVTTENLMYPGKVQAPPEFEMQSDGNKPLINPTPKPVMPSTDKTPSLVTNIPTVGTSGMGETLTNKETTTEQITYAPTMSNAINVLSMGQTITSFKQILQRDYIIDTSNLTTGGDTAISFTPYYLHPVTSATAPVLRKADPISIVTRCFTWASGAINTRIALLNDSSTSGAMTQVIFDVDDDFVLMPTTQGGFHFTQAVTPAIENYFTGTLPQIVVQRTMQQAINIQAPNYIINQIFRTENVVGSSIVSWVPGVLHLIYRNAPNNARFVIFRSVADNFQTHTYQGIPPLTPNTVYEQQFPYGT